MPSLLRSIILLLLTQQTHRKEQCYAKAPGEVRTQDRLTERSHSFTTANTRNCSTLCGGWSHCCEFFSLQLTPSPHVALQSLPLEAMDFLSLDLGSVTCLALANRMLV